MKNAKIFGMAFLAVLWVWLCVVMFTRAGGFTLKNIILAAMSGVIVFVPLWKRYGKSK